MGFCKWNRATLLDDENHWKRSHCTEGRMLPWLTGWKVISKYNRCSGGSLSTCWFISRQCWGHSWIVTLYWIVTSLLWRQEVWDRWMRCSSASGEISCGLRSAPRSSRRKQFWNCECEDVWHEWCFEVYKYASFRLRLLAVWRGRGLNKWKQDGRAISVWKGNPLLALLKYFMKPQQQNNSTWKINYLFICLTLFLLPPQK